MGAWSYIEPHLRELAGARPLRYVGRPGRASPAEGYAADHEAEQRRIIEAANRAMENSPARRGKAGARRSRA
jgi:2-oxoglutarate dehydrogenase E1 component